MSTQITIRLPEDLVEFVDAQVVAGLATSRADLVAKLLRRQVARARAVADLEIIRAHDGVPYPDLAGLAELAPRPLDLD
jgi:Arc/MetJ-type ribon-helix-helix transcriptional regulator